MFERHGAPAPRRLLVWFTATTIIPAVALGWLGWRMADRDRSLQGQRRQEAREQAVELAATVLQRTVAELEERLATASAGSRVQSNALQDGAALVVFGPDGVIDWGGTLLPYYPALPPMPDANLDLFARADALEFQQRDSAAAIRVLAGLASTKDATVRAEALVRLARNARKLGSTAQALAAFDALIALDTVRVGGWPAGLGGQQGRALLFAAAGRRDDLRRDAELLNRDLQNGRWLLTRAQYEFGTAQVREWLGQPTAGAPDPDLAALASAAEAIWSEWQARGRLSNPVRLRQTLWAADRSVLVLTRTSGDRLVTLLVSPAFLDEIWRRQMRSMAGHQQIDFALSDADGRDVFGKTSAPLSSQSVRTASGTQLPWTVHAVSLDTGLGGAGLSAPARLMLAAVFGMIIVVMAGGYFINRAIAREIQVARLQSDFVAAVSHEFRTPLTTLRHLSELLVRGRVSTEGRRHEFYETLLRESQRLHRLVEGLLNFARLESGQLEYRFETIDPAGFLAEVVAEFQLELGERGGRVAFLPGEGVSPIRADRELLARVIWNLLDNAVKYSPKGGTVRVELGTSANGAVVRVRDEGPGIPAEEQTEIFRKFVRGSASKSSAIKGTGIGLAMAREIVRAHDGEITVESRPGDGSTFSVVLPHRNTSGEVPAAHARTA
jgi:signal transduction histidine kinase